MQSRQPAGLGPRTIAFGWDYLVILTYLVALVAFGALGYRFAPDVAATLFSGPATSQAIGFALITLPVMLYYALSEASARKATWGKSRVGLVVVDAQDSRRSLWRSLVRTAVKFIPWEIAHFVIWRLSFAVDPDSPVYTAGFIAVWVRLALDVSAMFVGTGRQALHDRVAHAFVVRQDSVT